MTARPAQRHTFVFADLAGYTALTDAHGDERAADVAEGFSLALAELLVDHAGEAVKHLGDGILLRLDSAADALRLAARAVGELGSRHGSLGVRVGMHTGPAVRRADDWFGAAVNLAARVAAEAGAGEVLLTRATHDEATAALRGFAVRPRGASRLKNVSEPVELFALVLPGDVLRDLEVDPVCRMAVDKELAHGRVRYGDEVYTFCPASCADLFRARPQRFFDAEEAP
jgi:adenylate cyclase